LALLGRHNIWNVMAAIATGFEAGIPLVECAAAAGRLRPPDKRGEVLNIAGATVINDCYNSNPEALKSMIATLASMPAKRRILVAGEMLELGREAISLHQQCGTAAAESGIDLVVGVRGNAQHLVLAAREAGALALFLASPEEAGEWLKAELRKDDAVLLKASRGVGLEQALRVLQE
jgi:UDP-N-acetylmuramoyl-tripeptide--D-alanyl-D-alanine ligase